MTTSGQQVIIKKPVLQIVGDIRFLGSCEHGVIHSRAAEIKGSTLAIEEIMNFRAENGLEYDENDEHTFDVFYSVTDDCHVTVNTVVLLFSNEQESRKRILLYSSVGEYQGFRQVANGKFFYLKNTNDFRDLLAKAERDAAAEAS